MLRPSPSRNTTQRDRGAMNSVHSIVEHEVYLQCLVSRLQVLYIERCGTGSS